MLNAMSTCIALIFPEKSTYYINKTPRLLYQKRVANILIIVSMRRQGAFLSHKHISFMRGKSSSVHLEDKGIPIPKS